MAQSVSHQLGDLVLLWYSTEKTCTVHAFPTSRKACYSSFLAPDCRSLFGVDVTQYHRLDWGIYKEHECISHSSESWKVQKDDIQSWWKPSCCLIAWRRTSHGETANMVEVSAPHLIKPTRLSWRPHSHDPSVITS